MTKRSALTADEIRNRLTRSTATPARPNRPLGGEPMREPAASAAAAITARWRLRRSVALLDIFSGRALTAISTDEREVALFVATDCERVTGPGGDGWRLRIDVRRATIAAVGAAEELVATLDLVPPEPGDLVCAMAVAVLRNDVRLGSRTPPEMAALIRALDWLRDTAEPRPTVAEVTRALDLASVLGPLRAVAGGRFVGRRAELALLDAFVAVDQGEAVPLLLHGPGGVGKSTLLARYLLTNVSLDEPGHSPSPLTFAYLTFDRTDLTPARPLSLLGEACRQLRAQDAALASELDGLEGAIASAVRLEAAVTAETSPSRSSSGRDAQRDEREAYALVSGYATVVRRRLARRGGALLWVLDTFEQAQRHGPAVIARLDRFLKLLRTLCPEVRVVVAGRVDEPGLTRRAVPLLGFDDSGAVAFLQAQMDPIVVDLNLLTRVVDLTRGNPLSLRLAADLARQSGPEMLRTEVGQEALLRDLRPELLQGVLYRRILDHIPAPDIRALANPGLAVRRITREVISEVLAEPCGLGPVDEHRARRLFDGMRHEVSLVTEEEDGVLVHRSDVRAEMLPLLTSSEPLRVAEIHASAVDYYRQRVTPRHRAEELYHRLMLGQSASELDSRWQGGATPWLQGVLDELPPNSRAYLAHRLGVQVGSAGIAQADGVTWSRKVAQEARALLDLGRPLDALSLLDSRPSGELDAELLPLRIEALAVTGRQDDAIAWLDLALERSAESGDTAQRAGLALLGARILEDVGNFAGALDLVEVALGAFSGPYVPLVRAVSALVTQVRLARRQGTDHTPDARARWEKLVEQASSLSAYERARNPSLLRELAAEVGTEVPELLREAAAVSGIDVLDPAEIRSSGSSTTPNALPPPPPIGDSTKLRDILGRASPSRAPVEPSDGDAEREPGDPESAVAPETSFWSGHDAGAAIGDYLATSPGDDEARDAVSDYFRSEVDASAYDYRDQGDGAGA